MQIDVKDLTKLLRFSNILIQQFPFFLKIRSLRGFYPFLIHVVSNTSFLFFVLFSFYFLFFFILILYFSFFLNISGLRCFAPFLMACVSNASFFYFFFSLFFYIFYRNSV